MSTIYATSRGQENKADILNREAILLRRWIEGDQNAFNTLVNENLPAAQRLALKLTKDPNLAEDIVSEMLIRVYRSAARFRGGALFSTWLHRIVVNCVMDAKRKKGFQLVSLDDAHAEDDGSTVHLQIADAAPDPLDLLLEDEQLTAVRRSIDQLCDEQKKLVFLFHKNAMGYRDIAYVTCLPVGTVKSRLHRARQTIKDQIDKEERRANNRITTLRAG